MLSRIFIGAAASALIGAGSGAYVGYTRGHDAGYGRSQKEAAVQYRIGLERELVLWTDNGACRVNIGEIIDATLRGWEASCEAREALAEDLRRVRAREAGREARVAKAIQELEYAKLSWSSVRIPHDALRPFCVSGDAEGCDPLSPAGAERGDDLAVRGGAAADGSDPADGGGADGP